MNAYLIDTLQQTHSPLSSDLAARLREVAATKGDRALRRELRHAFPLASAPQLRRLRDLFTCPSREFTDLTAAEHWNLVIAVDPAGVAVVKLETMLGEPTKFILRSEVSNQGWTLLEERAPGAFASAREPAQFGGLDEAAGSFYTADPTFEKMAHQRSLRGGHGSSSASS